MTVFPCLSRTAFASTGDLIWHPNNHHGQDLTIENMTFKDMAEFEKWKIEGERMTKSWYVKQSADRKTKEYTKSWLRCNRTGGFVSKNTRKRAMKSRGSAKTGCSCPPLPSLSPQENITQQERCKQSSVLNTLDTDRRTLSIEYPKKCAIPLQQSFLKA